VNSINVPLFFIALFFTLFVPGYAWLAWSKPRIEDPLQRLADAMGLSIALTAFLGEVFWLLGMRLGALDLILLYTAILLAWMGGWLWRRQAFEWRKAWGLWLGLLLFAGLVVWRLYQARELALPAWVDSVHHTTIVRKILEFGGVPSDLSPYIPAPFYYHYGFHLLAALFSLFSRLDAPFTVLIFSQVLNAAIALSIYRLVKTMWKDTWRAALAALFVGLAMQMPAYYLSWGRSTLTAGMVLLPLAMAAALELKRGLPPVEKIPLRQRLKLLMREQGEVLLRLAVLTAGICLTHYLVLLLFGLFLFVLFLAELWQMIRNLSWRVFSGLPFAGAALGGLLALPWMVWVWQNAASSFKVILVSPLEGEQLAAGSSYFEYIFKILGPEHNFILMGLGLAGVLLAIFQRGARRLAGWSLLVVIMALPWGVRIAPFRPDHMAIVLFFPLSLFLGHLLVSGAEWLGKRTRRWIGYAVLTALALTGLVFGMVKTADIVNPATVIADQDDLKALNWISTNTPKDARFFANPVGWTGKAFRGADGGYWITPYTGRWSLVPPALYMTGSEEYIQQVTDWMTRATTLEDCSADFWLLVRDADLDYLYIKEGESKMPPYRLYFCPRLEKVYQQGKVWIYRILGR
jgi:hypothetical protein